jgi:hypothetical protein
MVKSRCGSRCVLVEGSLRRGESRILKSALNHEDNRNLPCAFAIEKTQEPRFGGRYVCR